MVSGMVFFTVFHKPVESVDSIKDDLRKILNVLCIVLILIVGGIMYGLA